MKELKREKENLTKNECERRKGARQKMRYRDSDQLEMRVNKRAYTNIEVVDEVMNKERESGRNQWTPGRRSWVS